MNAQIKRNLWLPVLLSLIAAVMLNSAWAHANTMKSQRVSGIEIATLAIGGYDPVAYFEMGRPVRGSGYHSAVYQGATYLFTSKDHLRKFEKNPRQYAPQYGGFCAYGVAVGKKFYSDPGSWKIVNGKLYLNLDGDIQKKWNENITGYIAKAETNWKKIQHKYPADL